MFCLVILCTTPFVSARGDKKIEPKKTESKKTDTKKIAAQQKPQKKPELFVVDQIVAIIYGDDVTVIITKSDTEKLNLDGKPRTLPDSIFEQLVYMDALKFKIGADPEAVDRYIAMIMRENKLSQADITAMFRSAGYTFEEGRQQLSVMFAVNTVLDFKVKSRLIVPESKIISFYQEHPVYEEEAFLVERVFVPAADDVSAKEMQETVDRSLKLGKEIPGAEISSSFWVKRSEIAEDKQFLTTMQEGKLSRPEQIKDGFEMFKVLERKPECLVPLEKRYQEISGQLRKPLYDKLFEEYRKSLFDAASIVYY